MDFTQADKGRANPHFTDVNAREEGYKINCQTCTVAYELRRRGFNVEALPNKNNEFYTDWCPKNNFNWNERFLTLDGKLPKKTRPFNIKNTIEDKARFIDTAAKEKGRYEVYVEWKGLNLAHVFTVERQQNNNLLWLDPQTGKYGGANVFENYLKMAKPYKISVMRMDDKIINPKFATRFKNASK